jgi:hypothetical protein
MGKSRGDKVRISPFKGAASQHVKIARRWPDLLL